MPKKELKPIKGSVLKKEEPEILKDPGYKETEKEYISALQSQLETAQKNRDQSHEEFDNLDYISYWQANERGANTTIQATKNKGETLFQTGTLRTKMLALLSTWTTLNMEADISAFDEHDVMINNLGNAMEDIIDKTQEVEGDDEKRMLRQYEMLKQGFVFVEDLWQDKWETVKDMIKGVFGQKKNVEWKTEIKKSLGMPKRKIISGLSVYLGNLREYMIEDQPYIFTVELMDYSQAEKIWGDWEMWDFVSKKKKPLSDATTQSMASNNWRLLDETGENQVEVIKYQNKTANEFQIVLNGVPMLPLGYPLTEIAKDGEYTITQQNLEPIRHDFAYGKSFIFKNKNIVAVLDMMMKLAVLKTKKSFLPPMLNLSDRVISRDVLMPAKITRGIGRGDLVPLSEHEATGVTASEFGMIDKVTQFIDRMTVSQTFAGQKEEGGKVTATQVRELQRQSAIMMGLLELAATLLKKKLTIKRLGIVLHKWFDPVDEAVDEVRNVLRNRYRLVSRFTQIQGKGKGMRITMAKEGEVTPEQTSNAAKTMGEEMGMPVELAIINPSMLKIMKLIWFVTVVPKEKKSSDFSKAMFGEMAMMGANLSQMGVLSPFSRDYMDNRFAEIWEGDSSKMFEKGQPQMPPQGTETGQGAPKSNVKPQVKVSPQEGAGGIR